MSNVVTYPSTPKEEWSAADHTQAIQYVRLRAAFAAAGSHGTFPRSIQLDGLTWMAVMDNDRYRFVPDAGMNMEMVYASTSTEPRFQTVHLDEKHLNITPSELNTEDPTAKTRRKTRG